MQAVARTIILILLLCWEVAQPVGAAGQGQPPSSLLAETGFDFRGGWILLPVTIEGKKANWILDTGASSTVLDSTYAAERGLAWGEPVRVTGATRSTFVRTLHIPEIEVAGLSFNPGPVAALDLRGIVRGRLGVDVQGILGKEFLEDYVTRIDYANGRVSFHDPVLFHYQGQGKVAGEGLTDGLFTVPVAVDGGQMGRWAVDTGAAGSLSFHLP